MKESMCALVAPDSKTMESFTVLQYIKLARLSKKYQMIYL